MAIYPLCQILHTHVLIWILLAKLVRVLNLPKQPILSIRLRHDWSPYHISRVTFKSRVLLTASSLVQLSLAARPTLSVEVTNLRWHFIYDTLPVSVRLLNLFVVPLDHLLQLSLDALHHMRTALWPRVLLHYQYLSPFEVLNCSLPSHLLLLWL